MKQRETKSPSAAFAASRCSMLIMVYAGGRAGISKGRLEVEVLGRRLSPLASLFALLFVRFLQTLFQLPGKLVVAVLAHRLLVKLEKLGSESRSWCVNLYHILY